MPINYNDLVDLGTKSVQPGSSSAITQLTGDVTAGPGAGSVPATLAASGAAAGTYTNPQITVDAKGRVTSIATQTTVTVNTVQSQTGSPLLIKTQATVAGDADDIQITGAVGLADTTGTRGGDLQLTSGGGGAGSVGNGGAGGSVSIVASNGGVGATDGGAGSSVIIQSGGGGLGSNAGGNGAAATLIAGSGGTGIAAKGGNGGSVTVQSGAGGMGAAPSNGGNVLITAAAGSGGGTDGGVTLTPLGSGGVVTINGTKVKLSTSLPTSDPGIPGRIYQVAGALMISL